MTRRNARKEKQAVVDAFWGAQSREPEKVKRALETMSGRGNAIGRDLGLKCKGWAVWPERGTIEMAWEHGLEVSEFGLTFADAKKALFRTLGKIHRAIWAARTKKAP
ncbi:MAG: hypothetical protein ACHREM_02355 [Polyangiales bacterium]